MQVESSVVLLQWITQSELLLLFLLMAATEVNQQWVGSAAQGQVVSEPTFSPDPEQWISKVTLTTASMGKVLSLQSVALSCGSPVWGHGRLAEGWAFWWCGMYHAHVWVPLSDTLKGIGWHVGCPGAVLQLSSPLFPSCCSRDKLSSHASLLSPTASNYSGSCTGFSHEQQPFRGAGIFSSWSCISSDISTTSFTE